MLPTLLLIHAALLVMVVSINIWYHLCINKEEIFTIWSFFIN